MLAALLAGCGRAPSPAEIETVSMAALQRGDEGAERRLSGWAREGLPVAERELALLYRKRGQQESARGLFERAARQGDAQAAWELGELARERMPGQAAAWYRQAAERGHAGAALALALQLKNGNGVRQDKAAAAHWLDVAATAGNAHAMFLLSNAYAAGDGVAVDGARARALLERAADREYPAALQQLALVMQAGDAWTARDPHEAQQLLKEAEEHRRSNARRF
nr:sel1 repeat family protein [Massilia sp. YIM B02763]